MQDDAAGTGRKTRGMIETFSRPLRLTQQP
jgi:hypothetical protein